MDSVAVLDTGVLIAALTRADRDHAAALAILRRAERAPTPSLELTDFVLAETLNFLVRRAGLSVAKKSLEVISSSPAVRLTRVSNAALEVARTQLFPSSKGMSFVDCLTVAHMRERERKTLYSFDRDFDAVKGIRRLAS